MMNCPFKVGDIVRIVVLHDNLDDEPPETFAVYRNAFMRPLRVDAIDHNGTDTWIELNVNDDGSQAADWTANTFCLPPNEVELVRGDDVASNEK